MRGRCQHTAGWVRKSLTPDSVQCDGGRNDQIRTTQRSGVRCGRADRDVEIVGVRGLPLPVLRFRADDGGRATPDPSPVGLYCS